MSSAVLSILPVGSGSGGNSVYFEIDDQCFLVDFGVRYKALKNALEINGKNLDIIRTAFLTHTHYDHTLGFSVLKKHMNMRCYASKRTRDEMASPLFHGLEYNKETLLENGLKVTCFRTSHDCPGSSAFLFEYHNVRVGYATDLGYMPKDIFSAFIGCHAVILESNHDLKMLKEGSYPMELKRRITSDHGHLSNIECADTCGKLYQHGTRIFFLAHLSKENNLPNLALKETASLLGEDALLYVMPDRGETIYTFNIK